MTKQQNKIKVKPQTLKWVLMDLPEMKERLFKLTTQYKDKIAEEVIDRVDNVIRTVVKRESKNKSKEQKTELLYHVLRSTRNNIPKV